MRPLADPYHTEAGMNKDSVAAAVTSVAGGLLLAASVLHFAYAGSVVGHVTDGFQP